MCISDTKTASTSSHRIPVLSIGSGTGLLEALLHQAYPNLEVTGVEVARVADSSSASPDQHDTTSSQTFRTPTTNADDDSYKLQSSNLYLCPSRIHLVPSTTTLSPSAEDARVWLFIYPRTASLISSYIQIYGLDHSNGREGVQVAVFVVPRNDAVDLVEEAMQPFAAHWRAQQVDLQEGLVEWEVLLVYRRVHTICQ